MLKAMSVHDPALAPPPRISDVVAAGVTPSMPPALAAAVAERAALNQGIEAVMERFPPEAVAAEATKRDKAASDAIRYRNTEGKSLVEVYSGDSKEELQRKLPAWCMGIEPLGGTTIEISTKQIMEVSNTLGRDLANHRYGSDRVVLAALAECSKGDLRRGGS